MGGNIFFSHSLVVVVVVVGGLGVRRGGGADLDDLNGGGGGDGGCAGGGSVGVDGAGLNGGGVGVGVVAPLELGESQLSLDGGGLLREGDLDGLGKVGGAGVEASLISVPVKEVVTKTC